VDFRSGAVRGLGWKRVGEVGSIVEKQSESGMSSRQQEERAAVYVNKRGGQESKSRVFVIGSAGELSRVSDSCLEENFTRTELMRAVMYERDTSFGIRECPFHLKAQLCRLNAVGALDPLVRPATIPTSVGDYYAFRTRQSSWF
jgi:hypothetical protein